MKDSTLMKKTLNGKQEAFNDMDALLVQIADYVFDTAINSELAFKTAYLALLDSLACATLAWSGGTLT